MDMYHLLYDYVFTNTPILTGSILFCFVVFFIYKNYKGNPSKTEIKENNTKMSEIGIPKPCKKQEYKSREKPDLKNVEKPWKTIAGLKNKTVTNNPDDLNLQLQNGDSPNKSPKFIDQKTPPLEKGLKPLKKVTGIDDKDPTKNNVSLQERKNESSSPKKNVREENVSEKLRSSPKTQAEARKPGLKETSYPKPELVQEKLKERRTASPPPQKQFTNQEVPEKTSNIHNSGTQTEARKPVAVHKRQLITRPERDEKKEEEDFQKELQETARKAEEEAKRVMRPINLNIDKNARTKEESKKIKEKELNLVRMMCGEFREVTKLDSNEEKEEKRKEMEKVRSARSYFKTADKYRSESMSAVPRMKMRIQEENFETSSQMRLSQFEPGKIKSKFTNIFDGTNNAEQEEKQAPPKKKLITLNQVMKKNVVEDDNASLDRQIELEELRQAKKNWDTLEERSEEKRDTAMKPKPIHNSTVMKRWTPVNPERAEKTRSLDVPQKLNMNDLFCNDSKSSIQNNKKEVEKELDEIREARPTPLVKRWNPKPYKKPSERSQSAHVPHRATLSDSSWVLEKSESRMEDERKKALDELEFIKKMRLESLGAENADNERPSSRQEVISRYETLKELEDIRRARLENQISNKDEEKQDFTNEEIKRPEYKYQDAKCVRFDEARKEKVICVEKEADEPNSKFDMRVKTKLQQIKQQTEIGMSKLSPTKFKQDFESNRKRSSREELSEKAKDILPTRSRSLSRIRNAGQKMMELTNEQLAKLTKTRLNRAARAE